MKIILTMLLLLGLTCCKQRQSLESTYTLDAAPGDVGSDAAQCICGYSQEKKCVLFRPNAKLVMHKVNARGQVVDVASFQTDEEGCNPESCDSQFYHKWVNVPLAEMLEHPGCGGSFEFRDLPGLARKKAGETKEVQAEQNRPCFCRSSIHPHTFDFSCGIFLTSEPSKMVASTIVDCASPNDCKSIFGSWGQVQRACNDEKRQLELSYENAMPLGVICRKVADIKTRINYCRVQDEMGAIIQQVSASGSCKSYCENALKKHSSK